MYRKEDIQTHEYSLRWLERRLVADMIRQNLNGPISTYQADSLAKSIGKYMDDVYYWLETVYQLAISVSIVFEFVRFDFE